MDRWLDFTEEAYSKLLKSATASYQFVGYNDELTRENILLWRHDVDYSIHRAHKIAILDNAFGVTSTFFLQLSSEGYNLFEGEIAKLVRQIILLGHQIGLHFDPSVYTEKDKIDIISKIEWEKNILERLFETSVSALSFHNPEYDNWLSMDQHLLCGLVNTYSRYFKEHFGYCSDSNGYWRFDSIGTIIDRRKFCRLQILTHPENWTPEPLPPRRRIVRCVEGRAAKTLMNYDRILSESGRENIDN